MKEELSIDEALDQVLERPRLSAIQLRLVALVTLAIVLEGFDIQLAGIAAPQILAEWHATKSAYGVAVAAALLGMAVGAPAGGWIADRLGRRPVFIAGLSVIGALTGLIGTAHDIGQFAMCRFLAGIGFGAVLTVAPTIAAEWMPRRLRQQVAAVAVIGIPVGGMFGAALGGIMIPVVGWRSVFFVGGALPVILAMAAVFALPESLRFLRIWPTRRGELIHKLHLMNAVVGPETTESHRSSESTLRVVQTGIVSSIFSSDFRASTFGLALAFFSNLAVSYAFFSWVPVLLGSVGVSLKASINGLFYFNFCGTIGAIVVACLFRVTSSRNLLITLGTIGAISSFALAMMVAQAPGSDVVTLKASWIAGLGSIGVATVGGQATLYALGSYLYPTDRRASGLGFVGSAGRIGGLVSAASGGLILAGAGREQLFFFLIVGLFLLALLGGLVVNRHWYRLLLS